LLNCSTAGLDNLTGRIIRETQFRLCTYNLTNSSMHNGDSLEHECNDIMADKTI